MLRNNSSRYLFKGFGPGGGGGGGAAAPGGVGGGPGGGRGAPAGTAGAEVEASVAKRMARPPTPITARWVISYRK